MGEPVLVLIPGFFETPDVSTLALRVGAQLRTGPDCKDAAAVHAWYREVAANSAARSNRDNRESWILVGFAEGADLIARHYYQFFGARQPDAIVLLSPRAASIHLNNITCPYLAVHGEGEWAQDAMLRQRISEAVSHHQYRYGDATEHKVALGLDRSLGGHLLDPILEDDLIEWIRLALRTSPRPQEELPAA